QNVYIDAGNIDNPSYRRFKDESEMPAPQVGDKIKLKWKQDRATVTFRVDNLTQGTFKEISRTCSLNGSSANFRLPNTGRICFIPHGGVSDIESIKIKSDTKVGATVMAVGDSKTQGWSSLNIASRWPALIKNIGQVEVN